MFSNYFKMAYRSLIRNKLPSFINFTGLAVSIGCCIIFFLLLDMEYTSDRFHENAEKIFMVGYTLEGDKNKQRWGDSPQPLGPALTTEFPQIEKAVRVANKSGSMRYQEKVFKESIRFVDPDFFSMFTFPLNQRDKGILSDKNALILSQEYAEKYFGDENPIGKQVSITFNQQLKETFFIKGVAEKFHHNASFSFNILASIEKFQDITKGELDDWSRFVQATFIQVNDVENISTISNQMEKFRERHNASRFDRPISSFIFEHLPTLSWESQEIQRSISSGSTPQILIMLFIVGLFLVLQACSNYVNITLVSGTHRYKEIGIRKVTGSTRFQIVKQFLGENFLLCFLALFGGIILTELVLLPGFNEITGNTQKISLFEFFTNFHLWIFFVGLLIITGFGAGFYPALVVSKYQPIQILRGKIKSKKKDKSSSISLALDFGITFLIICLVIVFWQNNKYQQKRDWGYNQNHVINLYLEEKGQFEIIKNVANQNLNILNSAGTVHAIGRSSNESIVEVEGEKQDVSQFDIGFNYLKTLGIRLKGGRFFDQNYTSDLGSALMVNKQFMENMGWQNVLDKTIRFDNKQYSVIGVVEDFHYNYFFDEIRPVIFRVVQEESFRYLSIQTEPGKGIQTEKELAKSWRQLFPDSPFTSFFQDNVFENAVRNISVITKIFTLTALITLVISCMGLFGLVSLLISKRLKEISIHKVHGATVFNIANMISKRFVITILISFILVIPFGFTTIERILDGIFKYHMSLDASPFILAGVIVLLTAIFTIASQIYKASVKNPIDALRYE